MKLRGGRMKGQRRLRRTLFVVDLLLPIIGLLVAWIGAAAFGTIPQPIRNNPWLVLAPLLVVGAVLAVVLDGPPRKAALDLGQVADETAIAVQRQWLYEAQWRRLYDPYAMSIR